MVFKYDTNEFRKCKQNSIIRALTSYGCFALLFYLLYFSIFMENKESYQDVIIFTTIYFSAVGIACVFGILVGNNILKKLFVFCQIECNDNEIIIINKKSIKIKVSQINKIFKDKYNYTIIANKFRKIKIFNCLEKKDDFEKYLTNISVIEKYNIINDILEYVPIILFIISLCLFQLSFQLHFISKIIVFLSTVFFTIKIFISKYKFWPSIFSMFLYGIIIIFMIISIYNNIKSILHIA
jgi:hypothetical protein